ncbi:8-oxo-dGTP pyrophosphatase MutT (NUDIX family) [Deinococcus metallilatus]|uniref:8-oxo-dGTP pyrophosphatase MutT (NUDIX family) n=1 Tax=Deinococcus metallilatus TaxID=1211322 RepID=A0ABR6MRZ6_9DEIO|nr:8-oxo-dGTP pyrophosphatase MutT (NUDIX family) [Deinococcus metallilatus]
MGRLDPAGRRPGETEAEAAVREAWEEGGARVEVTGGPVPLAEGALCFPAWLLAGMDAGARLVTVENDPDVPSHAICDSTKLSATGEKGCLSSPHYA